MNRELAQKPRGLTGFLTTEGGMHELASRRGDLPARPATAAQLGNALGWVSLGLGAAALLRPRVITQMAGLDGSRRATQAVRAIGVRELATGAGLLLRPHKPGWLWARVAGDALDLGLLAAAGRRRHGDRMALASALVAGIATLDLLAAWERQQLAQNGQRGAAHLPGTIHLRRALDINRSPEECYRFWRDFANFPSFMQHVEAVRMIDATRSHWTVRAPLGRHVEWTAELSSDVPSQQLGWRTLAGSEIEHAGAVHFVPGIGGRGTRVQVDLSYVAPLGRAGARLAKLFGEEPSQQVAEDLRRFKQLIETGEIPTTVGQPAGRRSALGRALHKGQPG